ncbi:alpha-1 4-glucan-protein synthase [Halapricum desulfuricans]|uniref:alpha-1 4-glucan-protein synthase n=1 Tax=Halapricum desulfuricans TaxID=2841257 RepID=UPI001E5883FF|nr:alpha-1 4-glucan-protein synthase [Halapricum desulfuricans]
MTADICVIVPTIREHECVREYVANARRHGFDTDRLHFVLVTEDFCDTGSMESMLEEIDVSGDIFDGSAREAWFAEQGIEEYSHLIPEASHAQTSFGLLYLWAGEFEYGVFIDDDTLPHEDSDFFGTHMDNLHYQGSIESVESDEQWVNVLHETDTDLYPRGYPYSAMDETVRTETTTVSEVVASQGLWTNVPDLDAVRILMDGDLDGQAQTRLDADDYGEDFVAAPGQYLTVCSMNLAFRREIVPAFYQLPMDDNPWDVGRFDDIWSGVFLKRAADLLGKQIYNGAPLCEHNKAPRSTFGDLANEVAGLELNEHVWELADRVPEAAGFADAFERMADELLAADVSDYENGEFFAYVGEHMHDWLDCLAAIDADGVRTTRSARSAADD